ncbi:AraC family transcriptional regulator [Roseinatronobacter sp. S2]|uniref:helix-turn-helix transcriptional regulator n=1 Tax=Roseinatronobacter sp. S2 TaxID=3035471 RepID=UPI00240FECCA|nr:AraC family transcriptional regulator [Roseinatronobacter sp. S2]WFE75793.1 AraC family transcriptional regulator [Roseinatronobacter sp. S2]
MTQLQHFPTRLPGERLFDGGDLRDIGENFGQQVEGRTLKRFTLDTPLSQGRVFAHKPWAGLYFGGYDIEYLQDNELTVREPPALFCGFLLAGQQSVTRIGADTRVTVRVGEPLILGFSESVECVAEHRAGQHCAGIGLRIEASFFESDAPETLKSALEPFRHRLQHPALVEILPASPRLTALADAALNSDMNGPVKALFLEGLLMSFLAELCQLLHRADSEPARAGLSEREWRRVVLVADYLRATLDQTPSLAQLARLAGVNATTLGRQFQALYGAPIFAWFRNLRLDEARSLLRSGNTSVTEVCFSVGFTNPAAFSTAYRRRFGHPPSLEAVRATRSL